MTWAEPQSWSVPAAAGGEPELPRGRAVPARDSLVLDCGTCAVRGDACRGCVVSVLLGPPPETVDAEEREALDVLARSGLVPPLRLVPGGQSPGGSPGG